MDSLPVLAEDNGSWVGDLSLPSWAGFLSCRGRYNARDRDEPSDGRVRVRFFGDAMRSAPSPAQRAALAFLTTNEAQLARAVVGAIFERYATWRDDSVLDDDRLDEIMPRIQSVNDLPSLMGLGWVHVLAVEKSELAYVGFEIGCTWEEEHGVGVLTHGMRIIEVGHADTAFASWAPEKEGATPCH